MKKIVVQGQNEWVLAATRWLDEKQLQYKATSLYVPAGETPKPIYRDWESKKPDYLNKMKMIQIDDVLDGYKKNIFKQFFYDELPSFASNIEYFDGGESQADLGILGLGMNGHVAFHEPGLSPAFYSGCVRLQSETLKNLDLVSGTWGKTYGAGAFNGCKALLLAVKGEKKKEILMRTLAGGERSSKEIPACALLSHPDLTVLTDFEI